MAESGAEDDADRVVDGLGAAEANSRVRELSGHARI